MMIDEKKLNDVARLAKLKIKPEDSAHLQEQLNKVLVHFDQLSSLSTENIKPLITPVEMTQSLRDDVVEKFSSAEELLNCAPDRSGHLYKVPPVVG